MDEQRKLFYIDFIKAFAILWVTGFHVCRFVGNPVAPAFWDFDVFRLFYNVQTAVLLFFIVASFLTSKTLMTLFQQRRDSFQNEAKGVVFFCFQRFIRLAPAYYFAIFFWSFQDLFLYPGAVVSCNLKDILNHMLFFHTLNQETAFSISGTFWYIGVLAQYYVIAPLLVFLVGIILVKKQMITIHPDRQTDRQTDNKELQDIFCFCFPSYPLLLSVNSIRQTDLICYGTF